MYLYVVWNVHTVVNMHEIENWIKNSIKRIKLNGVVTCVIDGWIKISIFNEILIDIHYEASDIYCRRVDWSQQVFY